MSGFEDLNTSDNSQRIADSGITASAGEAFQSNDSMGMWRQMCAPNEAASAPLPDFCLDFGGLEDTGNKPKTGADGVRTAPEIHVKGESRNQNVYNMLYDAETENLRRQRLERLNGNNQNQ